MAEAYEVLSDADKRRKYDRCGEECVNEPEKQSTDIFGGLFGNMFGQQQEQTGPSISLKITVTLEELYTGADFELAYNRNVICPHCRGSGADDPDDVETCPKCDGQGMIIKRQQIGPGMV